MDAHIGLFSKADIKAPDIRWTTEEPVYVANLVTPSTNFLSFLLSIYYYF